MFEDTLIFEDHYLRPILERVGFRESNYSLELIWEKNDKYEADIVTAGLFLLAKSHKVYINWHAYLLITYAYIISITFPTFIMKNLPCVVVATPVFFSLEPTAYWNILALQCVFKRGSWV